MYRVAHLRVYRAEVVNRLAQQIEDPAECLLAYRYGDRPARVHSLHAAHEAVRAGQRHASNDVVAQHLGNLDRKIYVPALVHNLDCA